MEERTTPVCADGAPDGIRCAASPPDAHRTDVRKARRRKWNPTPRLLFVIGQLRTERPVRRPPAGYEPTTKVTLQLARYVATRPFSTIAWKSST